MLKGSFCIHTKIVLLKANRKRHSRKQLKAQILQHSNNKLSINQREMFHKFPTALLENSFVLSIPNYREV